MPGHEEDIAELKYITVPKLYDEVYKLKSRIKESEEIVEIQNNTIEKLYKVLKILENKINIKQTRKDIKY